MQFGQYRSKEEYVHEVFSSIAHRYDLLNTTLSFNRDKYWRKFTVEHLGLFKAISSPVGDPGYITEVGLADACYHELTGGIVAVHVGRVT